MRVTKFGHCCLLLEEEGIRLLTDPGNYSETPDVSNIDVILLTHEHQDHLHIPSIKKILEKNPVARIMTNAGVGKILAGEGIAHEIIDAGKEMLVNGVSVQRFGSEHACIHPSFPAVENGGFFIAKKLFYPGDSFHVPPVPVKVLALPVAGPWMKIEEAIVYAQTVNPKIIFPVHDGMLRQDRLGPTRFIPKMILEPLGITFTDMIESSVQEF